MKSKNVGSLIVLIIFALLLTGCPKSPPAPDLSASFSPVSPREAEDLYAQAETALRDGKAPRAMELWERIVQKYPSTPVAAQSLNRTR